ncbi:MAG: DUF4011 domain-containing protein [Alphaproteobacteria bacterium]|nr:DUF4011 domain-containing protein [Alphaproteobacteria bacterium]
MKDLRAALEEARRGLLDLSTRNRLLSLPKPGASRGVMIIDNEDADFVLGALQAGRAFGFEASAAAPVPDAAPAETTAGKPRRARSVKVKPEGVGTAKAEATREEYQRDDKLRVQLPASDLVRRLRDITQDARTAREETGVPTLYLALGALIWRDPATPETERRAPLALLPVALEREGVSQNFKLRDAVGDIAENLSLREMLKVNFKTALPEFDTDAYTPTAWAEAIAALVAERAHWRVEADALAIGLFSFAKFLMWRDLGPEENPGLADHPMVRALVGGEALTIPPVFPDEADVDTEIPVERLDHVMDVDGSQALAAEAVRRGGHVVIQGPPGTGKSQTISNIIAQAVLDGRSVLFVAEKLAALEVVKRRLESIGLGAACLELHSEKQSKRAVLDELRATLSLPMPPKPDRDSVVRRLGALRGRINRHAAAMRATVGASGMTLHQVIGALVGLRQRGVAAPEFFVNVSEWDAAAIEARRDAVKLLAGYAADGGAQSPWRGVMADIGPADADRLLGRLPGWVRAFAAAGAALGADAGPQAAQDTLALNPALAAAPPHDAAALKHVAWAGDLAPLEALVQALGALQKAKADPQLLPSALDVGSIAEARATLAEAGGVFGFLSGARRDAKAVAARVARDAENPLPTLDAALAGQAAREVLRNGDALARAAFGTLWQQEASDPAPLAALLGWRKAHGAAALTALANGAKPVEAAPLETALAAFQELQQATKLDARIAFGAEEPSFTTLAQRLGDWAATPEALDAWLGWRRAAASANGLEALLERLADGRVAPETAEDVFAFALHEALLRAAMTEHPELAAFDGAAADRLVADFREADRARITLTRAEAAHAHAVRVKEVRDGAPGMAVLRGEMEKKRGHLPVRELMLRASQAVQKAKPIFMMSPLSVAQFLAPPHGLKPGLSFDLLVIDEASQVEPVDALGAITRCRQVVVVGDDKQMPPTRFFQRMTGEEGDEAREDTADDVAARDVESILGLCNARGLPSAMLRWHYRSRHESLIATSNAEFYDNRLFILPSPRARSAALGLSLRRVEGRFDTGGTGTNAEEARAVAEAVIAHARETPGDTLGIAAFSIRQRDAILNAVEAARRDNPDTEAFFGAHPDEPFFVKNLENVQGDERDSIMISVGYGRGADGKLAMRFGPLSADGGERRLNVLITRAKKRCIVFSSIGADDIDLARASGRGVATLKSFLAFAAAGDEPRAAAAKTQPAPIAAAIGKAIEAAGKEAVPRVGMAGLFLDVAARDAGDYVLGIEADAGDWAALRSARDRERGRASALEGMGWKLARAWSLSWYGRPEAEAARIAALLGAAPATAAPEAAIPAPATGLAEPYREAAPEVPKDTAIADVPFATLAAIVADIINVEAPITIESLAERVRLLWGLEALPTPARDALRQALALARQLHGVKEEQGFLLAEASIISARDRRAVGAHLRRAAAVSPREIAAAAEKLLALRPRTTEAELAAGIHRLLGLDTNAAPAIAARLAGLIGAGVVKL